MGIKNIVLTRWDQLETKPKTTWDTVLALASTVTPDSLERIESAVNLHSTANIQFTSGTTGSPKATMLTHSYVLHQLVEMKAAAIDCFA